MAKINNILSDREACEFMGVKNIRSIVSKFIDRENIQSKLGCWHVSELCRVYGISDYTASEKIQNLFMNRRITTPLLIGKI